MSEVKEKILPHSRAKLDFYEKYLERYLAILSATPWIDAINIFDIFCGTGIYKDGNAGSPIIAFNLIEKTRQLAKERKWPQKKITLSINDLQPEHIEKVSAVLKNKEKEICDLDFNNLDSEEMFDKVIKIINSQSKNDRNLIFIDYLKKALSFNEKFYSASYYIQRDKGNYFTLFFITPNLLGFEKIIDVLWYLDKNAGSGFDKEKKSDEKNKNQINLLDIIDYRPDSVKKIKRMKQLDNIIDSFLKNKDMERNNDELTKLILKNSFRIKHANEKLNKLQTNGVIEVINKQNGELARKGSFYLGAKNIQLSEVIFNLVK
jgi:hypothetical protein